MWGLFRRSPLAVQTSLEGCTGRKEWPWIVIARDPSRKPSSPYLRGAASPANNALEVRGTELFGSGEGVKRFIDLRQWELHHSPFCSPYRSEGPPFLPDEDDGRWPGLSDSSLTPRCCTYSRISPTSAYLAKRSLLGGCRIGRGSPVSIWWYTLSVSQ
jgi:hypothetical protein